MHDLSLFTIPLCHKLRKIWITDQVFFLYLSLPLKFDLALFLLIFFWQLQRKNSTLDSSLVQKHNHLLQSLIIKLHRTLKNRFFRTKKTKQIYKVGFIKKNKFKILKPLTVTWPRFELFYDINFTVNYLYQHF